MASKGQGTFPSIPLPSFSSSNLSGRNCVGFDGSPAEVALGVCDFGKSIGLNFKGNESEVFKSLERMEERDRGAIGRSNNGEVGNG